MLYTPPHVFLAVDTLMLDLVFANFTDLKSVSVDSGLVTPDTYCPPLSIDVRVF
jgi:hypothetical protein